jgi:hypothetical protein
MWEPPRVGSGQALFVIPTQVGSQPFRTLPDPGLRRGDGVGQREFTQANDIGARLVSIRKHRLWELYRRGGVYPLPKRIGLIAHYGRA